MSDAIEEFTRLVREFEVAALDKLPCDIPARTLPPCDLPWGHDDRMHANAGDGFYARDFEAEHVIRQHCRRLLLLAHATLDEIRKADHRAEAETLRTVINDVLGALTRPCDKCSAPSTWYTLGARYCDQHVDGVAPVGSILYESLMEVKHVELIRRLTDRLTNPP